MSSQSSDAHMGRTKTADPYTALPGMRTFSPDPLPSEAQLSDALPGTRAFVPGPPGIRAFAPRSSPHVTIVSSLIPDGTRSVATRVSLSKGRRRRPPGKRRAKTPRERALSTRLVWGITRIALGFVFLWAFLDHLIGFGRSTPAAQSWLNGGSPVRDYLLSVHGTFAAFFNDLARQAWTEPLYEVGLAAIGVALILGMGMRVAACTGGVLLIMMWLSALPVTHGPILDEHLIYTLAIAGLALANAGDTLGLGTWWSRRWVVRRIPVLR
jgi:thiosulfate dehydrogenase [quinone] large subunit